MGQAKLVHIQGRKHLKSNQKKDEWVSIQPSACSWSCIRFQTFVMEFKSKSKRMLEKDGHVISLKCYPKIDLHHFLQAAQRRLYTMLTL
jgi:hypothetical protein